MNKKRLLILLMVVGVLAACGDGSDDSSDDSALETSCSAEQLCEGTGRTLHACDSVVNGCTVKGCVEIDCTTFTVQ